MVLTYRIADGVLTERRGDGDARVVTSYPHSLASGTRTDAKSELAFAYAADLSELNSIQSRGEITRAVTLELDGAAVDKGETRWRFIVAGSVEIGDCAYPVWRVRTRTELGAMDQYYSPDLCISPRAITRDEAGKPLRGVVFDRIERAP